MRASISDASRDLEILGRLAVVPGAVATVIALLVVIFLFLASIDSRPVGQFAPTLYAGTVAAVALGWFGTGIRRGSALPVKSAALTFSLGVLLLVAWWSLAGEPAIAVILTASTVAAVALGWCATRVTTASTTAIGMVALTFWIGVTVLVLWWTWPRFSEPDNSIMLTALVPLLAASSWWALPITSRLRSRVPAHFSRPHATRRLSFPRDARAFRALGVALEGGLLLLLALLFALALGLLLRQGGLVVSNSVFGPRVLKQFRRARAILALRAQEVRVKDRRPPVLLVRSFADDELVMQRTKAVLVNVTRTGLSLEEQMVAQLWEVGPVVAIGQPGQGIDPIGAAREHIVGPLWQPRVNELINESALVVLVLGKTEGLFWEYEQLARLRVPVLVVWPPSAADGLANRWLRFTVAYPPARSIVLEAGSELPLLVWFPADQEPLIVSGQTRDERSYELAFALWRHNHGVRPVSE